MVSDFKPNNFKRRWFNMKVKSNPPRVFGANLGDSDCCKVTLDCNPGVQLEVPRIVVTCCNFIQTHGLQTCGIFRVSGSLKRIASLQALMETDPNSDIDLKALGFTPFDVAGLLTRYLKSLPEPVIPLSQFQYFRDGFHLCTEKRLELYRDLIHQLPRANFHLLLYLLTFLSELSTHSELTKMPAVNLAAVFQPSVLSQPHHTLHPEEYIASQRVVEFLIHHIQELSQKSMEPAITSLKKDTYLSFAIPPMKRRSTTSTLVKKWLYRSNSTSSTLVDETPFQTQLTGFSLDSPPLKSSSQPKFNFIMRTFSVQRVR